MLAMTAVGIELMYICMDATDGNMPCDSPCSRGDLVDSAVCVTGEQQRAFVCM